MALNYEKQGKYEAAISAYQVALDEDPNSLEAISAITRLASQIKNDTHAMGLISEILSTYSKDSAPESLQENIQRYEDTIQSVVDDSIDEEGDNIDDMDMTFTEDIDDVEDMNLDELIRLGITYF